MRNTFPKVLAVLLLCAGIAIGADAPAGKLQINLKAAAVVPAGEISLGQVAEVSGDNSGLVAELAAMTLGNTPLAGNARTVSREHVAMFLIRNGLREDDISVKGARACTVTVRTLKINGNQLVECARQYLASMPVLQSESTQVEVERMPRDKRIAVGDQGEGELELSASVSSMDRPWGRVRVYVKIRKNHRTLATIPVMFQVTSRQQVIYATKAIRRGDKLDETCFDVREVLLDATTANASFLGDVRLVAGKEAGQSIAAGAPILASMLSEPFAAMRGEDISVLLRSSHMEIVAKGVALNDGHIGDVIPVTIGATGKRIVGKVVSVGTVEMPL